MSKGLALPSRSDVKAVGGRTGVPRGGAGRAWLGLHELLGDLHDHEQRPAGGDQRQTSRCHQMLADVAESLKQLSHEADDPPARRAAARRPPDSMATAPRPSRGRRGALARAPGCARPASATRSSRPRSASSACSSSTRSSTRSTSASSTGGSSESRPAPGRRTTTSCWTTRSSTRRSRTSPSTRSSSCRSRWPSGCRWRCHQPEDPRAGVLPLGLLLPVAGLVGRDHHDRALHLQLRRAVQPAHRQHTPWFTTASTALWSFVGLNAWTTVRHGRCSSTSRRCSRSPTDVYEAAALDNDRSRGAPSGGSRSRCCGRPTSSCSWSSAIGALKLFDQAFIVSGGTGGPNYSTYTPVLYIYREAFHSFEFGVAAAAGVVLFVIIFVLTLVQRADRRPVRGRDELPDARRRRGAPSRRGAPASSCAGSSLYVAARR